MNVPMWKSGPELRNTERSSMPDHWAMSSPCAMQRAGRQHRRVGPARERGRVDQQQRRVGRAVGIGIVDRAPGDEGLVLGPARAGRIAVGVVADPAGRVDRPVAGRPHRGPTSSSCQTTTAGARSSMTKASSSGCWRQFDRAEHRPDLAAGDEQLLQPEGVLAEPGHPIAGSNPGVPQRVAHPVDPCRGLGPGQRAVTVGERDRGGPGTRVRAERIGQRAAIGRHRKNLSGATRAPDGRQCDGLRRFEDRRRPCTSLSLRATASLQSRLAVREGPARSLTLALHPARWVPAHWVPARWQSLPPDLASLPALRFLACPPGHPCLASVPSLLPCLALPARPDQ